MKNGLATAGLYCIYCFTSIIVSAYGYSIYSKRKKDEHDAVLISFAEGTLTQGNWFFL